MPYLNSHRTSDLLSMSPFDGNDIFDDDTESSTSSSSRDTHVLDLHTTSPDHVDTSTFDDRVPTLEGLDLAMNASTSVSTSHENYTRLDEEARVIHWLLDTGANESITNVPGILDRIKRRRIHLQGISEKPVIIDKIGTITGSIRDTNGIDQKISLDDVCYSEKSHMNLLATSSLVNEGAIIHLEQGNCYLQLSHGADASHGMGGAASVIPIEEENGLYIVRLEHLVPVEDIRMAYKHDRRGASTGLKAEWTWTHSGYSGDHGHVAQAIEPHTQGHHPRHVRSWSRRGVETPKRQLHTRLEMPLRRLQDRQSFVVGHTEPTTISPALPTSFCSSQL